MLTSVKCMRAKVLKVDDAAVMARKYARNSDDPIVISDSSDDDDDGPPPVKVLPGVVPDGVKEAKDAGGHVASQVRMQVNAGRGRF